MLAWLSTSKVLQSTDSKIQNSRDVTAGQTLQMASNSGDTRNNWLDQSDYRRDCHVNSERENIITTKSELNSLSDLSEREKLS